MTQDITRLTSSWPPPASSPPTPSVEVFLAGTMAFVYKPGTPSSTPECEVGFHCASASHKLQVFVYENTTLKYYCDAFEDSTSLDLGIDGKPSQVFFYQAPGEINRSDPGFDRRDFRWLIDLEHSHFYGRPLTLNSGILKKRLHIKHGIFFADRTAATFDVIGGPRPQAGIYVARQVRTEIALTGGDCVSLKAYGHNVIPPMCNRPGVTYRIFFMNLCRRSNGSYCVDNDFYLNFDVPQITPGERFELALNPSSPKTGKFLYGETGIEGTDEAPCMGSGYGQGPGGFPPFPPG